MFAIDTKTASHNALRTFAAAHGLKFSKVPPRAVLVDAINKFLAAQNTTPAQAAQAQKLFTDDLTEWGSKIAGLPRQNRGYEAKVALKVALLVNPESEELFRRDVSARFQAFRDLRNGMEVLNETNGSAVCAFCGKHHIADIYEVRLPNGQVVPVGDDCIENVGFINGDGYFALRREIAYAKRVLVD